MAPLAPETPMMIFKNGTFSSSSVLNSEQNSKFCGLPLPQSTDIIRWLQQGRDWDHTMEDAGEKLRRARERLHLTIRDVEEASRKVAIRHANDEYIVGLSRLSEIENK